MINKVIRKTKRAVTRLRNRFQDTTVILLYHRVTDLPSDPQLLAVSPEAFSSHLALLKANYPVLSLQELVGSLKNNNVPNKSVVITFDDGYADNLYYAKPLLEQYGLPATVFVSSGSLDSKREFWWDELERLFLLPGSLPQTLTIIISGTGHYFNLGASSHYKKEDYERSRHWNVQHNGDPTPRHAAYRSLVRALYHLSADMRETVIKELHKWAGTGTGAEGRDSHLTLTCDELRLLSKGSCIEIGAHAHSHSRLSALSPAEQQNDILGSKTFLEKTINLPVESFSYPFGSSDTYTEDTINAIRASGFSSACANTAGGVRNKTDLFQLPRFLVRNWEDHIFAEHLKHFFIQ